jgi:hypothetical protein
LHSAESPPERSDFIGYSRDKRPGPVEVVIALIVTPEGLPPPGLIGYGFSWVGSVFALVGQVVALGSFQQGQSFFPRNVRAGDLLTKLFKIEFAYFSTLRNPGLSSKFVIEVLLCLSEIELVDHVKFASSALFELADQKRV